MKLGKYKNEAQRKRDKQRLVKKFGDNARFSTRTVISSGANTVPLGQRSERPSCSDDLRDYNIATAGENSSASNPISSSDRVRIKLEEGTMDDRQVRS
jgi:hypothetical protein